MVASEGQNPYLNLGLQKADDLTWSKFTDEIQKI